MLCRHLADKNIKLLSFIGHGIIIMTSGQPSSVNWGRVRPKLACARLEAVRTKPCTSSVSAVVKGALRG